MIESVLVEPSEVVEVGEERTEFIIVGEAVEIIEVGVIGPPGKKGDKGDAGNPAIEISFSFGDATPLSLFTALAGKVIQSVTVYIENEFDGGGASLRVGDAGQLDRLMTTAEVDPKEEAAYQSTPGFAYDADTEVLFSITPGAGASQGSGLIVIEVQQ